MTQTLFLFFDYCSSNWEKTFYVPGNHEYYDIGKTYDQLENEYRSLFASKYTNVFFLNNSHVTIEEKGHTYDIYGTTFWTFPPFKTTYEAESYVNDYNNINMMSDGVTIDIEYMKSLSKESYDKLKDFLSNHDRRKTIVVTHFPPFRTGTSNPKYNSQTGPLKSYFSWDDNTMDDIVLDKVMCWFSGHTHWSYDIIKNDVRFISNQLGYMCEYGDTCLNGDCTYNLNITTAKYEKLKKMFGGLRYSN